MALVLRQTVSSKDGTIPETPHSLVGNEAATKSTEMNLPLSTTRRILLMGLPGAGKTTLATKLALRLNAVHFNADEIRANINRDLGFSVEDRIEQARRMGWLCDQVARTGNYAIADFICPTPKTREAFGPAFIVWLARIEEGRFQDTNHLFVPPSRFDMKVTADGAPEAWVERIMSALQPVFSPKAPTAFFLGRYQPFHGGHRALILEGIRRVGQACIAVRDTYGINEKNPYPFEQVRARIEAAMADQRGRFTVIQMPNVTNIFYGRDVGYAIEHLDLGADVHAISATNVRALLATLAPESF